MKKILIVGSIFSLLIGTTVWAGSLTVPNTFVGGQKALASEVNENFDEVESEVTDNADNISSHADSIDNLQNDLDGKLDAMTCFHGQVLKYNTGTGEYECADDLDTTDADTLDGLDSSDFALSQHSHPAVAVTKTGYFSVGLGWNPNGGIYYLPVHLPHGAEFISFTVRISDSLDPENLIVYLTGLGSQVVLSSSGTGTFEYSVDLTGNFVDNMNNVYLVEYQPWSSSVRLTRAVIEYEYK